MKIIDLKLLQFNNYLKIHTFNRSTAAKALKVSERQLTRYLNRWQEESFIEYTNGVGRGNHSNVQINIDIEQYFVNVIINNIYDLSIEDIELINTYPFSYQSKNIINSLFNQTIHQASLPNNNRKIMDYIYRIPKDISPYGPLDIAASLIIFNTMDRLYELSDEGVVPSNIVAYDELTIEGLVIHLHQDICFSNGHLLFAENVVECLNKYLHDSLFDLRLEWVTAIEVINDFTLLLRMTEPQANIKYILSQPHMSIYKEVDGQCIGTGVYHVHQHTSESILLRTNVLTHHVQPDISEIILVSDLDKYQQYFDTTQLSVAEHEYFHKINFIIFNPNSDLKIEHRTILHNYFHDFIQHHDAQNHQAKIMIQPVRTDQDVKCPQFKMLVIESFKNEQFRLYKYLQKQGLDIVMVKTDFSTFLEQDIDTWDVDFIWLNEASPELVLMYNLLKTSKFSKWLLQDEEGQKTLEAFESESTSTWDVINKHYIEYLKQHVKLSMLSKISRRYYVEKEYKNLVINPYGVMLYNQLIYDKEEQSVRSEIVTVGQLP